MAETTAQFVAPAGVDPATAVILDCRSRLGDRQWGQTQYASSHLPGAHFAHLDRDLSELGSGPGRHPLPDRDRFSNKLSGWGIGRDSNVVVYDDAAGAIAARAWWLLRGAGVRRVAILDGGWQAWLAAGREVSDQPSPGNPVPLWRNDGYLPVTGQAQLKQRLRQSRGLLLDARAARRFDGIEEPIDRLAGHIPGGVNWPLENNLADGRLRPPADLRRDWQELLGATPAPDVVHMCGSGVTACFNLACMEHLGLSGSSLYVESWSGWISDPDNPIAAQ